MHSQVYFVSVHRDRFVKIGVSRNIKSRIQGLRGGSPYPLRLLHYAECSDAYLAEEILHYLCAHSWVRSEWFKLNDSVAGWCQEFLDDPEAFIVEWNPWRNDCLRNAPDNIKSRQGRLRFIRNEWREIARFYRKAA